MGGFANRHLEPEEPNSKVGIWLSCSGHLGRTGVHVFSADMALSENDDIGFSSKLQYRHVLTAYHINSYHIYMLHA